MRGGAGDAETGDESRPQLAVESAPDQVPKRDAVYDRRAAADRRLEPHELPRTVTFDHAITRTQETR